jgi:hypothetical protein
MFHWRLDLKNQFALKSHYSALICMEVPNLNEVLWLVKAPLKIIFLFGTFFEVSS